MISRRKQLSQYDTIQAKSYHSNKIWPWPWQQRGGCINASILSDLNSECTSIGDDIVLPRCITRPRASTSPEPVRQMVSYHGRSHSRHDQCCAATPTSSIPSATTQYEWLIENNAREEQNDKSYDALLINAGSDIIIHHTTRWRVHVSAYRPSLFDRWFLTMVAATRVMIDATQWRQRQTVVIEASMILLENE